jgi:hypothetical protein
MLSGLAGTTAKLQADARTVMVHPCQLHCYAHCNTMLSRLTQTTCHPCPHLQTHQQRRKTHADTHQQRRKAIVTHSVSLSHTHVVWPQQQSTSFCEAYHTPPAPPPSTPGFDPVNTYAGSGRQGQYSPCATHWQCSLRQAVC